MNQLTREILTEILSYEEAWDKKTRKLKYNNVLEWYREERACRFDNLVMFPKLLRAHRMLSVWFNLPLDTEGFIDDVSISDTLSNQLCGDSMYNVVGYPARSGLRERDYWRDSYLGRIWDSDDWLVENPSEQEILELEIKPTLVPAKEGQPALF